MTPYATADVYLKKPTIIVRLRDVFAEMRPEPPKAGAKTRMRLLQRGQYMTDVLPNGLPVRVEHRRDGTWWFIIPNIATYPLVVEPMPIPKRRLIWSNGAYHLPFGMRQPVRFFIRDSIGNKVRNLYAIAAVDGSFRVGSRFEIGATTYVSDHGTPTERAKRRADKVRQEYPYADEIFACHDLRKLLRLRPTGKWKRKWLEYVTRAQWGVVHKGDLPALQSAITAAITEHLWTPKQKRRPSNFWDILAPLNTVRQKIKRRRQELEIEPPLPIHSGSW
jgi:hypothetical protein